MSSFFVLPVNFSAALFTSSKIPVLVSAIKIASAACSNKSWNFSSLLLIFSSVSLNSTIRWKNCLDFFFLFLIVFIIQLLIDR
ncbi:hypothetical protein AMJ47_01545 [Parcubacteria bacterium DG_72]|nr:MAG: hypothetical protein AMJ47_01545 [Parcubacteria bacterium DG_72]